MATRPIVVIVHLSDFHMGLYFHDKGESERWYAPIKRLLGGDVEPKRHDSEILKVLRFEVKNALRESKRAWSISDDPATIYVVTGDIATGLTPPDKMNEFHFAFLTSEILPQGLDLPVGLGIAPKDLLFVPGNHERFAGGTLTFFVGSKFGSAREHLYETHRKFDYLAWVPCTPRPLLIVCLDTGFDKPGCLSRGRVEAHQVEWICSEFETLARQGRKVDGAFVTPDEFSRCIKVLVAHHCVCRDEGHFMRFWQKRHLKLLNLGALDRIIDDFHIALFGHVHRACTLRIGTTTYGSAGTVSQKSAFSNQNGFSLHCVREDMSMDTREYVWTRERFKEKRALAQRWA